MRVTATKLAYGMNSCATAGFYGFNNADDYHAFWNNVYCSIDVPSLPADPSPTNGGKIYHIAMQMPEYQTTGYSGVITSVCYSSDCTVTVQYHEYLPKDSCWVYDTPTQFWAVYAVELPDNGCTWQWNFEDTGDYQYDCTNPDCFDFTTVESGTDCSLTNSYFQLLDTQDKFDYYWSKFHVGVQEPTIDFADGYAAYAVHVGECATTGYSVEIPHVCMSKTVQASACLTCSGRRACFARSIRPKRIPGLW